MCFPEQIIRVNYVLGVWDACSSTCARSLSSMADTLIRTLCPNPHVMTSHCSPQPYDCCWSRSCTTCTSSASCSENVSNERPHGFRYRKLLLSAEALPLVAAACIAPSGSSSAPPGVQPELKFIMRPWFTNNGTASHIHIWAYNNSCGSRTP